MDVIKRSGSVQEYDPQKITGAMRKAFASVSQACDDAVLADMLAQVERAMGDGARTVEAIQDEVERTLMANGFYDAAKSYILYRQKRSELRAARLTLAGAVNAKGMEELLQGIQRDFPEEEYALTTLSGKFSGFLKAGMNRSEALSALVKAAVELTTQQAPKWEFIAARLLNFSFELELADELENRGIHSFYDKLRCLTDEGLYGAYILEHYTREEIDEAAGFICSERNNSSPIRAST